MANARRAGRNGVVMADVTTSNDGTLSTVSYVNKYTINMPRDKVDVTALGDTTKVKVAGLPDQTIALSGFSNVGANTFSLLTDGNARKINILFDNTNNTGSMLTGGTYVCDGSIDTEVNGAVSFSINADAFTSGTTTGI